MVYECEECGAGFKKLSDLMKHRRTENHWRKYMCPSCKKTFTRKDNLDRHLKKHENENNHHCPECLRVFTRQETLDTHFQQHHDQTGGAKKRQSHSGEDVEITKRFKKDDDPRRYYTLTKIKTQRMEKFKTTASSYKISFHDIEVTENVLSTLRRLFTVIFEDLTRGVKSNDLVRITVQSPSLDYPIVVPFVKLPDLTADRFMSEIERVLQSNEDFVIDSGLVIEITQVDMPNGGARKRCKFVDIDKFLADKKCIIRIQNSDDLCCARAIVTARARLDDDPQWNNIRRGRNVQEQRARRLHEMANVSVGECGVEEIKAFQLVLKEYQLHVVSKDHFNSIIYSGPDATKKIYLYYQNKHYDVITSMSAFLSRNYFCTRCNKGYDHKEDHKCNAVCHACRKVHEYSEGEWMECDECHRFFHGDVCFNLHKGTTRKGNSTCRSISKCLSCGKTVNKKLDNSHVCGQVYCKVCNGFFSEEHLCYMMPETVECNNDPMSIEEELIDDVENAKSFIFFDLECTQDDFIECEMKYNPDVFGKCQNCLRSNCGVYEHKCNLCVAQKVCTICIDKETECEHCGKREYVFAGENTLNDFCRWLFSEENYDSTVLCHNFQGYDSYPILQYLYKNAIVPKLIPNGAKIMCLMVQSCKIKMIDSINFLPMALAKLPEMFGLNELRKGYFPHLYNRKENQEVELEGLPDLSFYNPDAMKPKDKQSFLTWYTEHKNNRFNLQHELLEYCKSDVDILRRCCLKFREDFLEITGIDPFERCITIASACHLVFRTNFLQPETIGLIPHQGYTPEQKQSVKALQWLKYISFTENIEIKHARNGGEKEIGPYKADGYADIEGQKVVFEFHGDFWHGNPTKYARSTVNPVNQMTMGDLYDKTIEKQKYLESLGYVCRSIWESDFDKEVLNDMTMRSFIEQVDIVSPLEPRDAFYGGRTEGYTLYKEVSDDEMIDYYDVTSLYPWVNKTGKIPLGHPSIITENFGPLTDYEGLIKCKVIPPKGLFHPILPCKTSGKLLFHLCQLCAELKEQKPCTHADQERSFIGTWVTDEVKKAVQKGYKIDKIYEVWHFQNLSHYDPITKTGGLFTEYVNTFLKLKQEASGWPKWCETEQQKRQYIDMYSHKEGILLEYDKIKKNPGLRALAKLMLNSFWGKFGQRSNMSQVDLVEDPVVYFDKLTSDQEEVTCVNFVSDEFVEMRWKYKNDFVDTNSKTNVVIAAYTTAQARLKLYSYLEMLGPRALYADTDSIIFSTRKGEIKPKLNDFLGDLTDEIQGNSIQTFVTGGPKNYGYELQKPDEDGNRTHCKIRGITLNCKNMLNVNFNVLRTFVTKRQDAAVSVLNAHKISRDRNNTKIVTASERKDYKIVFDKRVIGNHYVSYPYGY